MKSNITTWLGLITFAAAVAMFILYMVNASKGLETIGMKWYYMAGASAAGISLIIIPQKKMIEIFMKFWNAVIKKFFILAFIVVSISSCSPEKRLGRLLKKNPHLLKADTVMVQDTVISTSVHKDSIFSVHQILMSKDTIIIVKDRLTQKIYSYRDSIYISGECATDTIIRSVPRYITKIEVKERIPWWWWIIASTIIAFLLWLIAYQRKRG